MPTEDHLEYVRQSLASFIRYRDDRMAPAYDAASDEVCHCEEDRPICFWDGQKACDEWQAAVYRHAERLGLYDEPEPGPDWPCDEPAWGQEDTSEAEAERRKADWDKYWI